MPAMTTWTRCNGFYRKEEPRATDTLFVDPTSWTVVDLRIEEEAGSMYARINRWRAPGFNEEALQNVSKETVNSLREWALDLARAQEMMKGPKEIQEMFEEAPDDAKALVLDGIWDLIAGLEDMDTLLEPRDPLSTLERSVAIVEGSPAAENLDRILAEFYGEQEVFTGKTLMQAVHKALFNFGVHPC